MEEEKSIKVLTEKIQFIKKARSRERREFSDLDMVCTKQERINKELKEKFIVAKVKSDLYDELINKLLDRAKLKINV